MFNLQTPTPRPSLFGSLNTNTAQPQSSSIFGGGQQQQQSSNLFSSSQPQQSTGLFGSAQPQQTNSLFGSAQPQQTSSLFGSAQPTQTSSVFGNQNQQPQQNSSSVFGGQQQQQQQNTSSVFGGQQPQRTGGVFGGVGSQPSQASFFGQPSKNQPQSSPFGNLGQSTQQQPSSSSFGQSLQLGQSQQAQTQQSQSQNVNSLWEEGRGLSVYRTIPAQMGLVKEKWDPRNLSSPLRAYLYQYVENEDNVVHYQPAADEDENKWEEAVSKRPGPNYVPALAREFWELGKRAQKQREFIEACNIRLHDINASLDAQLEIHSQKYAARVGECRRKHIVASQRTLALAAKIQTLRNRGYVMDNAEEELRAKLEKLEREVFDPSLSGREQEIWARMLGIRERGKRLKAAMEKVSPAAKNEDDGLDEETTRTAKKALEAYETQLRHLQRELELVQQEFDDWEKGEGGPTANRSPKK